MRTEVIMVLGRGVWLKSGAGWYQQVPTESGSSVAACVQDALVRSAAGKVVLIYEAKGMVHQEAECPKAGRKVFASISRIRSEFPVVVSEDLGWGMEPPVPVAGGSYSTLVHYELSRGLSEACTSPEGASASAAWSAFTLAEALLSRRLPLARDASVLFLLPGLVAFSSGNRGRRSFRVWPQPMSDRDWGALAFLAAGQDEPAAPDGVRKGGPIAVISEGEPTSLCPCWEEIRNSGRLECFMSLDELAECAARMPAAHPANLVLGFPTPFSLDPLLAGAAVAAALSAFALAVCLRADSAKFRRLEAESQARVSELLVRGDNLEGSRREIDSLQKDLPESPGALPCAKSGALLGLAAAIPDSLTLTRFRMGADDGFEIEATLVGREFDQESVIRALAQAGLLTASPGSWAFDPGTRRLLARGRFVGASQ